MGCTTCPSPRTISNIAPSLPVAGTEEPPVARMTASASKVAVVVVTTHLPGCCSRPVRRVLNEISTPAERAADTSASRTSRARSDTGKYLPASSSSFSGIPRSRSKNSRCPLSGHDRSNRRIRIGDSDMNRSGSSVRGRMLQRPPPLIRILRPPSAVRSRSKTRLRCLAAKIAATRPAAPAPTTTIGCAEGATSAPRRS
jgi:hypothetical protein